MFRATVLGGGVWGTTLAHHLARRGHSVTLWEFFAQLARRLERLRTHPNLPGLRLDRRVQVTSALEQAAGAEVAVFALPSAHTRRVAGRFFATTPGRTLRPLVSASKGLEAGTLKTMAEVVEEEVRPGSGPVFALSGPSFAREVAAGVPTRLVLAGDGREPPEELRSGLEGPWLKVEASTDRRGTELGGALKNVLAIACGIADGLQWGANTKAIVVTQAMAEMHQIVGRFGGRAETVYGPAGLGDLIATGTSPLSRNRTLGEHLGRGRALSAALRAVRTTAEGVETAKAARRLCQAHGLRLPLVEAVCQILEGRRHPHSLLRALGFGSDSGSNLHG